MCPNCGEHSTIVRMSSTALYMCGHCHRSMLTPIEAHIPLHPTPIISLISGPSPSILAADFGRLRRRRSQTVLDGRRAG